jgi:hypothetical protein
LFFFYSVLDGREWSAARPARIIPTEGRRNQLDSGLNEPQSRSGPSDKQKYLRRDCRQMHTPVTLRVSGQTLLHGGTQEKLIVVHPSFVMLGFSFSPNIVNLTLDFSYNSKNNVMTVDDGGEVGFLLLCLRKPQHNRLSYSVHINETCSSDNAKLPFLSNEKEPNKPNSEDENLHLNILNKAQRNINFAAVPPAVCLFSHPVSFIHSCASVARRIRR